MTLSPIKIGQSCSWILRLWPAQCTGLVQVVHSAPEVLVPHQVTRQLLVHST